MGITLKRAWQDRLGDLQGSQPPSKRPFTRIEPWVIKSGLLAFLSGNETKLLLALCFSANNKTAIACPTLSKIATLTGMARSSIPQAARKLEECGVLVRKRLGRRMGYLICHEHPSWLAKMTRVEKTARLTFQGQQRRLAAAAPQLQHLTANGKPQCPSLKSLAYKPVSKNQTIIGSENPTDTVSKKQTDSCGAGTPADIPAWVTENSREKLEDSPYVPA